MPHPAVSHELRRLGYADGVVLQKKEMERLASDPERAGAVFFVEHLPVITCGRSGDGGSLLATPERLAREGIEYHEAGRGGDVTYHGPGQWTVYPVLRLYWYRRDLHHYLRLLEECVVRFLEPYGIAGARRDKYTGVWVGGEKIAAVGVAVSRWVTWHGFALNIAPDLGCFTRYMHPCGITAQQGGVASLTGIAGKPFSMEETLPVLQRAVAEVLDLEWV